MKMITCVDKNWGIGYDGELLFHSKKDMIFFKALTKGRNVIMGRKTLDSLPDRKPLKDRMNIILTRNPDDIKKHENLITFTSIDDILEFCSKDKKESIVIGGGSIYNQFLQYCDTAYVTYVLDEKKADTFFPNLQESERWVLQSQGPVMEDGDLKLEFRVYVRR